MRPQKIEKLEMKVKEVDENNCILVHAVDDIERASKSLKRQLKNLVNTFQNYPCNVCGLLFQSDLTLRNHIRKSHGAFHTQQQ